MKAAVIAYYHKEIKTEINAFLNSKGIECRFFRRVPIDDKKEMEYLSNVEILLADPGRIIDVLPKFKKLRWLQSTWAGIETISDLDQIISGKITVTNLKRTFGELISEYVMGYIFAIHRNFFQHYENQKQKTWRSIGYDRLADKTIGLIGTGGIGSEIARKCFAFGMRTFGLNRTGNPVPAIDKIFRKNRKHEFFKECDIVVMTLPHTNETNNLVDKKWFDQMKRGTLFINAGRGKTVVQDDLINALKSGKVGTAVLDVFEDEPLSAESELWNMKNVYITPHVAGITFPDEVVKIWKANIDRYINGEALLNITNPKRGY